MGRLFRWSILLVLITFGFLWPVIFSGGAGSATTVDDPVEIADYTAPTRWTPPAGSMRWRPSPASSPSGRHGIFRYWDVANPNSPPGCARCRRSSRS